MPKSSRRARRVNTAIDVNWGFTKDCPYSGTIINLTVLGCALQIKDVRAGSDSDRVTKGKTKTEETIEIQPGQVILIRFWMPRKRVLKVEVVHKKLKGMKGFGAKFLDLTDEEQETLEQLVQLFGEPDPGKD
jgi:hypothetical protein